MFPSVRRSVGFALTVVAAGTLTFTGTDAAVAEPSSAMQPAFDRSLHLDHANNARDIGGYRTADGHWVRTGLVFRSNALNKLTAAEWSTLGGHGVNLDVDLRNAVERADDPDNPPAGITYEVRDVVGFPRGQLPSLLACPPLPTTVNALSALQNTPLDDAFTGGSYPLMVCYNGSAQAFAGLITDIATHTSGSILYHCTGGKDRTGWATAVLLTILGVPRDTVTADFLLSNTYHGAGSVQKSWLDSAFAEVNSAYGSFDRYVLDGLHLSPATVAALKARLLTTDAP